MNKKFLAKLLIFCLVFTMLPVSAFAVDTAASGGSSAYTVTLDANTLTVTAGEEGTPLTVKNVSDNVYTNNLDVDTLTVAWSVTSGLDYITLSSATGKTTTVTAKETVTESQTAVITATVKAGDKVLGEATCTVTVNPAGTVTVPVTYDANKPDGAAGEVTEMPQQGEAIVGQEFTLSEDFPVLDNYTCMGWGTTATATTDDVVKTITIPADSQGVTVYAIWVEAKDLDYADPVNGVVEITGNDLTEAIDPTTSTVKFDAVEGNDTSDPVTAVAISKETLDAVKAANVENVAVTLTEGTLTVPKEELGKTVDVNTVKVTLTIENIINDSSKLSSLPSNVTAKVALEVGITVTKKDGTSQPFSKKENYAGDALTVTVPNTASLTDVSHVYYVGDDTNSTTIFYNKQLSAKIEGVYIVITAPHFSQIVLTDTAVTNATDENPNTPDDPGPGSTGSGGGGSSSSNVTIASKVTGGTVSISPSRPNRGQTVTINVKPATGYKLDTLTVTDKDGNKLELTKVSDDKYTFVMPAGKVTVTPTFVKTDSTENPGTSTGLTFSDVKADAWYAEYIAYVVEKGMMNGYEDGRFGPNDSTTRAQIVTVLYRLEGEPATSSASFRDVSGGQYYSNAVAWAANNGIVNGYETGAFGPSDNVTREQIAAILYRYAEYKEYDVTATGNVNSFSDSAKVSSWATDAMNWAIGEGLINGDNGALRPQGNATRAEIATLLTRFCENIAK